MIKKSDLENYQDREHALVKHLLMQMYLKRFFMILGQSRPKLVFIDAFSGPWKSLDESYADTSFGRAMDCITECKRALKEVHGRDIAFRSLFIEKDPDSFAKLSDFVTKYRELGYSVDVWNESFEENVGKIVNWLEPDETAFILIDPKGYDGLINTKVLKPLLESPRVELLINYMWQFLNLATGHSHNRAHSQNLLELYGENYKQALSLQGEAKWRCFLELYKSELRKVSPAASKHRTRVAAFPVEYANHAGKKYFLVYVTHNHKGLITFLEESEKAKSEQKSIKFLVQQQKREAQFATGDMFEGADTVSSRPSDPLIGPWLDLLPVAGSEKAIDDTAWADLLEKYICFPSELQAGLGHLVESGRFEVVGVKRKRKKHHVHPKDAEVVRRKI